MLRDYSVICLLETKTDRPDFSHSYFNNYQSYILEKNGVGRHGGIHGICILIQKNISSHTSRILGTTSESIMWIHFDSFCLGFEFRL